MSPIRRLPIAFAILLLGIVIISSPLLAQGSSAILEPAWSYGLFGDEIGQYTMQRCDLGNDGRVEFIFEDKDRLLLVGWPEGSDEPHVLSRSPIFDENVQDIAVWFEGAEWRVAVLFTDDLIAVLDLPSFELVADGNTTVNASRLGVADVMNGPEYEIIVAGFDRSAVLDSTTIDELLSLTATGSDLAVGNVDQDSAVEIVFNDGAIVEIRDGSPLLEWTLPTSGDRVLLAELDGSPPLEIVIGNNNSSVTAYISGNPIALWGYGDDEPTLVSVADLTRDGRQEVIVVADYDDDLRGLHPTLGLPIWTENYESASCQPGGSRSIPMAGDLDGDGALELVWSSYDSFSGRRICAADAWSGDIVWSSEPHEGPVRGTGSGDLDGDGTIERFATISGPRVAVFVADEPTPLSVFSLSGSPEAWWYNDDIIAIAAGDVDRDGAVEIVLGVDGGNFGAVYEFDSATLEYERGNSELAGSITAVDIADLDGDNWPEIAFGGSSGSEFIIGAIEGATAELEWTATTPGLIDSVQGILIGEVDGDPALEIVAIGSDDYQLTAGSVIVVDTDTASVRWSPVLEFYGLELADLDGNGIDEILTGSETGELVALEAVGAIGELWRIPVAPTRLVGVRSYRDHFDRLMVAVSTEYSLVGIDPATGAVVWESPQLGEDVGTYDALERVEIPGETPPALLVGTHHSILEFRPSDLVIFADNFESGGTTAWSATGPEWGERWLSTGAPFPDPTATHRSLLITAAGRGPTVCAPEYTGRQCRQPQSLEEATRSSFSTSRRRRGES